MRKQRPIAVFDIDGTIFRSSLLIELNAELVRQGIFQDAARKQVARVREAWLDRKGTYQEYIDTIIALYTKDITGKKVLDIARVSRDVIAEHKHRVYVYTRELIKKLRGTHTLIIISFSPTEAVQAFNRFYRFDIVSGIPYEKKNGRYTGEVEKNFVVDKKIVLQNLIAEHRLSLRRSIGVGDTDSDIAFLSLVEHPIAFNPNKKLYTFAKKKRWKIVVERKDAIYTI